MPTTTTEQGASRAWRAFVALLAVVYAFACLQSAYDRVSAHQPVAERVVVGPFRSHADVAAARLALAREDAAGVVAAATRAIANRPVDAAPAALFGAGRLLQQDWAGAEAAFRVAAAGGWRDVMTQLYWTDQTIAIGEWGLAAARLDAVMRARPDLAEADRYREAFIADPAGRAELARMIAGRPAWLTTVLQVDDSVSDKTLAQRSVLLGEAARQGDRLGCTVPLGFVQGLLSRRLIAEADAVWSAQCPQGGSIAALGDPDMDHIGSVDPAGWTLSSSAELTSEAVPTRSGQGVRIELSGTVAQAVMSQPVRLAPGPLSVRWVATEGDRPSQRVDVAVDCGAPQRPAMTGGSGHAIVVPDCPFQLFTVWVRPGPGPVVIDAIRAGTR